MRRNLLIIILATAAASLIATSLSSCAGGSAKRTDGVPKAVAPRAADLSSPRSAVDSYLAWVTYSYRTLDSEVSSRTMDPYEGVRVDSYIELNRQKGRGLDQELVKFSETGSSREGTRTLLSAKEEWRYRYFDPRSMTYSSPQYSASYETTYTLARAAGGWIVLKVEAKPLGEVQ